MSKRETIAVPEEEITKQFKYLQEVNDINHQQEQLTGKKRLFYMETFGCQMNENDSERLAGMLEEMGYTKTDNKVYSNLIIYNTCCIRENAELKVYGHLGALVKLKRENPDLIIVVCGCMMQQPEVVEHIRKKYKHVDLVFGTHNLYTFPELLNSVIISKKTKIEVWESIGSITESMPISRGDKLKAWVTIIYGCDNFCSYCIVPYVRGRERSRKPEAIVEEVKLLGQNGYKEITLLGQNVNSYGKDLKLDGNLEAGRDLEVSKNIEDSLSLKSGQSFAKLLYELNNVEGIERIRFMTSHPKDLSEELIYAIRDCKKVCNHIHLPIQSGSTRILKEMNRHYTKEYYINLVKKIRKEIGNLSISTDIIVGFPGETDDDFNETIDLMEKIRFDFAYTFLYSKRTGTPAAKSTEQISEEVKKQRFERLVEVQNKISKEINEGLLGQTVEVLVEGPSKNSVQTFTGRTSTNKIVNFKGNKDIIGELVNVKIDKIQTWSIEGKII